MKSGTFRPPTSDAQRSIAAGLAGEGKQPVIGVRGAFSQGDIFADADPCAVGYSQFEAAWNATGVQPVTLGTGP